MEPTSEGANPGEHTLETALQKRLNTVEAGTYARTLETATNDFRQRVFGHTTVPMNRVGVDECRDYATELHGAVNDGEIAASTARRYYANVRALLTWCVQDGMIATNPAERHRATSQLPTTEDKSDQQFWDPMVRKRFLRYMDGQVDRTLDGQTDYDRLPIMRDRALAYVIGLSGVRGAEILRDSADDRRNGLRWSDTNLERGFLEVLGKSREQEEAPLPTPAIERLKRYRDQLDPASEDWPVFPVLHPPALARSLDVPGEDDRVDEARERDLTLPAMSIQAGRSVIRKHSEAADLPPDEEYLKLHGARRGLGGEIYRENAELAQETLRHNSIETTHEKYSDEHASDVRKDVEDVLGLD